MKDAIYSLGIVCTVVYLFSLLKSGQRKMNQIPLHYPCSTSAAAWSCGEGTALMEYIQSPLLTCLETDVKKLQRGNIWQLPSDMATLCWQPHGPAQPPHAGVLWMQRREVHFGAGSTPEVRQDLQNHGICEKIRLAGTSGDHLLQSPSERKH